MLLSLLTDRGLPTSAWWWGSLAEEEYIVPGVTQADLQAILADPARLQALLAEHPQLLELLG